MAKVGEKIVILGPGAVGGFLAALLWKRDYAVTCIGTREDAQIIGRDGIKLESSVFGNFIARPEVKSLLDFPPDILFIAVKAPFLNDALDLIPRELVENSISIPLLNGFEHIGIIRKKFGSRVAVGMIGNMEAVLVDRGRVRHATHRAPHLELASENDVPVARLQKIADFLSGAGIETSILEREADVIWNKFARLAVIATLTAAAQKPVGFVRSDPAWRKKLENCASEVASLARLQGVHTDADKILQEIDLLPENLTTSLQRDIAAGRPSELEAITGAILRQAAENQISCPVMKQLFDQLS